MSKTCRGLAVASKSQAQYALFEHEWLPCNVQVTHAGTLKALITLHLSLAGELPHTYNLFAACQPQSSVSCKRRTARCAMMKLTQCEQRHTTTLSGSTFVHWPIGCCCKGCPHSSQGECALQGLPCPVQQLMAQ